MNGNQITANMIFRMAKQSLASSRMRNIFVMITIVLASSLLTVILLFAAGRKQQEKNGLSKSRQVGYYDLTVPQMEILQKDARLSAWIRVKTGILSAMDGFDVMPYYVNELSDEIQIAELESGSLPQAEHEIALPRALLKKMGKEPVLGGKVTFAFYDGSTETFAVSGILKGNEAAKQFSVFFSERYAEHGSQLKDRPYEVYAKLRDASDFSAQECKEAMYRIGADAGIDRKDVIPSKAFLNSLTVTMQSVMIYSLVGAVILLACIFVIYGVFYLSVVGRIHQFGQLRTIGMTKKQMKRFVRREASSLFLRACPVGIAIGSVVGYGILPDGFRLVHAFWTAVLVLIVIYWITMVSVYKPARLAAAVSPIEALRYVPQDDGKTYARKRLCRNLTPFGLGIRNFSKNRRKAVITFVSLAFGGILFMTAAAYVSSFDKSNYARQGYFTNAEFHISFAQSAMELHAYGMSGMQAETPLDQEMVRTIAALDGVKHVEEIESFGVQFTYDKNGEFDNDKIALLSDGEIREIGKYIEEGSADYEKLMSGDYILVANNSVAQEVYGWSFAPGDLITLRYYDGRQMAEKEVAVLAVCNASFTYDYPQAEGWFVMPDQAVKRWLSYDCLNAHLIVSTQADKEEAVGEALAGMLADQAGLSLETLAERRILYEQNANQVFGMVSGLAVFIMSFSLLSMMNLLITNMVTRKQELAVLASIGMDKGQIRKMLFGESLLLVFVTVGVTMTAGSLCGYALSSILYQKGAYYMAFRFPVWYALAYAGILTIVPLVITIVSLRRFSKESLVERLRGIEN